MKRFEDELMEGGKGGREREREEGEIEGVQVILHTSIGCYHQIPKDVHFIKVLSAHLRESMGQYRQMP